MKHTISKLFTGMKDVIALILIIGWLIAIFLPEHYVDEITERAFERILLLVLGAYFGSKMNNDNNMNRICPSCGQTIITKV